MAKFSKEDLDWITTWTGCTAAVCIGLASTIATTISSVPGNKVIGIDKAPLTALSTLLGGVGAIALGVKSVFTNKTATMHPTTEDLEREATVQEQADYFKYSAQPLQPERPRSRQSPEEVSQVMGLMGRNVYEQAFVPEQRFDGAQRPRPSTRYPARKPTERVSYFDDEP
jgi:hypothetical protein